MSLAGAIFGMTVMGVLAAYIPWGSPGLIAFLASCAWFASPTIATGILVLMGEMGCIKKTGAEVEQLLCCRSNVAYIGHSWAWFRSCSNH